MKVSRQVKIKKKRKKKRLENRKKREREKPGGRHEKHVLGLDNEKITSEGRGGR